MKNKILSKKSFITLILAVTILAAFTVTGYAASVDGMASKFDSWFRGIIVTFVGVVSVWNAFQAFSKKDKVKAIIWLGFGSLLGVVISMPELVSSLANDLITKIK